MMQKLSYLAVAVIFIAAMAATAFADWENQGPHKMHFPQLPDPNGWDVDATSPIAVVDDWTCRGSGPVTDIHFWGSWKDDNVGEIPAFRLRIHADIPDPDPENPMTYSMPGAVLWEYYADDFTVRAVEPPSLQGWLDPVADLWFWENHFNYFQYNIFLEHVTEPPELFYQEEGTIYWLSISADVIGLPGTKWGCKSSVEHYMDDAVWGYIIGDPFWIDLYEPPYYRYVPGDVDGDGDVDQDDVDCLYDYLYSPPGTCDPAYCLGSYCPAADPNGDCTSMPMDWIYLDSYVNGGGNPPVYCQTYPPITEAQSLDLAFVINGRSGAPEGACCYNPTGGPMSACIVTTQADCETSLGGVYQGDGTTCGGEQACCLPDNTCMMADALCCLNVLGGTPQGPQSTCGGWEACCLQDYTCVMADALCCVNELGGTPQGSGSQCDQPVACCFQDGSCAMLDPTCCDDAGGLISMYSSVCQGDNNGNGTDDGCEPPEPVIKWEQPPDLTDLGMDVNATFITLADDFPCEVTGPIEEIHIYASWLEDIAPGQPDNVTFRLSFHSDIPADPPAYHSRPGERLWFRDFRQGDYTYEVVVQGINEWFYDPLSGYTQFPGDHVCWKYTFIIEEDPFIQEGTSQDPVVYWLDVMATPGAESYFGWKTTPLDFNWNDDAVYWHDGLEEWMELVYPEGHPNFGRSINFAFELLTTDTCAGQYPGDVDNNGVIEPADVVYLVNFLYNGGPAPPVMANADPNGDCWIDDADVKYLNDYFYVPGSPEPVYCTCVNPQICDCLVGDANGDGTINIGDEVYLENIVFRPGSPAPIPYPVCSGDANFDCTINIGDAVFIGNIVFRPGSPMPPFCHDWATDPVKGCGYPIYKK